jgi:hypothetical protein
MTYAHKSAPSRNGHRLRTRTSRLDRPSDRILRLSGSKIMQSKFNLGERNDMTVDLEGCLVQAEASAAWFHRQVLPLSLDQLRWRSDPTRWSIGECLDHLNVTLAAYLPKIEDAIVLGWREGMTQGFRHHLPAEIDTLRLIEPPVRVRFPAPPEIQPVAAVDPDRLVDAFHRTRDRYAAAVRRSFGLDLPRILIAEPICPWIHTLGGTLALMAAHDRRHIWQAEQVIEDPRFPRAVFHRSRERAS